MTGPTYAEAAIQMAIADHSRRVAEALANVDDLHAYHWEDPESGMLRATSRPIPDPLVIRITHHPTPNLLRVPTGEVGGVAILSNALLSTQWALKVWVSAQVRGCITCRRPVDIGHEVALTWWGWRSA